MRAARDAGSYALVLRCTREGRLRVGALGELALRPGVYLYVGSALGPGGLRARLAHHARPCRRPRWHVDHLRRCTPIEEVWTARGPVRLEHRWARALAGLRGARAPLRGFGSSDCGCPTHLFHLAAKPAASTLRRVLRRASGPGIPLRRHAGGPSPEA